MIDFFKLFDKLAQDKISDLLIAPGEPMAVRQLGRLKRRDDLVFSEDDVRQVILRSATNKAREILGKARQVNYACASPSGQRYRIAAYFERGRLALAVRILPKTLPQLQEIGLPNPLKSLLAKPSGLIIVASPSGHGKSTTIASLLDFINHHFEKNIVTVENPVEHVHVDDHSSFLQRGIPLDVSNFFEGLTEAYRLDPDVVMTDSLGYRDALEQALFLCEAGCLVIGAVDGGSCTQILQRIVHAFDADERPKIRGKLAAYLTMVISQRLLMRQDVLDRIAVFDVLVNTLQVKNLIRNDNLAMLRAQQEKEAGLGMVSMGKHLQQLVISGTVSKEEAMSLAAANPELATWLGQR